MDVFVIEMLVIMINSLRLAHSDSEFLGMKLFCVVVVIWYCYFCFSRSMRYICSYWSSDPIFTTTVTEPQFYFFH